ncbi:hypothetical protein ACMD2_21195 [Ananas comosus]|uniref:Uncharacterized protein n=1 Tax=Ananas comosus TaxID=4615 RepID=A0A199UMN8_ANACO|nr:hypothetical protein ACMD2_21195 [Ananas comosus]
MLGRTFVESHVIAAWEDLCRVARDRRLGGPSPSRTRSPLGRTFAESHAIAAWEESFVHLHHPSFSLLFFESRVFGHLLYVSIIKSFQ